MITLGVFIGLTLFTYQSKYDFSGLGPWLFGALIALGILSRCTQYILRGADANRYPSNDGTGWNVHPLQQDYGYHFCCWWLPHF